MTSTAKIEANRANAELSTGPVSAAGKAASSQNACQHNLTGGPALAPGENEQIYEQHLQAYAEEYIPQSLPEFELVKAMSDSSWRLDRVSRMEREVIDKCPNPFLEPDSPMSKQLLRLTRYRNSIQRTYDRAAKELQVLTEAATNRRSERFQRIQNEVAQELKQDGGTPPPEEIDNLAKQRFSESDSEDARSVLAYRNTSRMQYKTNPNRR